MELRTRPFRLKLRHPWTIAMDLENGEGKGNSDSGVLFVELTDRDGVTGIGEASPSERYRETSESAAAFFVRIDADRLSFSDIDSSMAYLDSLSSSDIAAKAAINIALLDGAARRANKPIHDFLNLGFTEGKHITSFSIGIDSPEAVEGKTAEASNYPILKLKLGSVRDRENLADLRRAAPDKPVRVDGNEAWPTKEEALKHIEWLAEDGNIQFVEQPMHADAADDDLAWLKERSPLPLMGDESYHTASDLERCARRYHAVNVKLVKAGGISGAKKALEAARSAGLKTMIGCMIESSVLISAAAHLAELSDYLDIDGNLLVSNDPYEGPTAEAGVLSFTSARQKVGLRVRERGT